MLTIGLTGGIASGKSTVAAMFAEQGAAIIDTDVIARELVVPGQPALEEIRAQFGDSIVRADASLDRRALREIVFTDAVKRRRLEAILHPRIRDEALRQAAAATSPYRIIVVPLLVESPMQDLMDRILVVDCDQRVQAERLHERDEESEEQVRRMIASQASRAARLAIADDIIKNDRSLRDTRLQVEALHRKYLSLA